MKNLMKLMVGLLLSAVLVMTMLGCSNESSGSVSSENGGDPWGNDTDKIQGWWKHVTSYEGREHTTYIEYDSSKKILRAGSDSQEYKDADFDTHVNNLKYDLLKQSVGQYTSFTKIDNESLPSWANTDDTNPSVPYTWETAPDEGKCITKEILLDTTWQISDSIYKINFYEINNTIKMELNNFYNMSLNIAGNIMQTATYDDTLADFVDKFSEIKIGTDDKGIYILTLKNGSEILDLWTDPISFKLTEGSYSNSN